MSEKLERKGKGGRGCVRKNTTKRREGRARVCEKKHKKKGREGEGV